MSVIYVHFNHISDRKIIQISRNKVQINTLSDVETVSDFLQLMDRRFLDSIQEKRLVLYNPKASRVSNQIMHPETPIEKFKRFADYYIAVFEGDSEQYFSDLSFLKNNLAMRQVPFYESREEKKTPKGLAVCMNSSLQKMALFDKYLKGALTEARSFSIPLQNFERLCISLQKDDPVAGNVPEQLLSKFFGYWIEKVNQFLSMLYDLRAKIGFTGGNTGSYSSFFAWETDKIPLKNKELLENYQLLANILFRLDISNGVPKTMYEVKEKLDVSVKTYDWFSSLIMTTEQLLNKFCRHFALERVDRENVVLFSLTKLLTTHYKKNESAYEPADNFHKNVAGLVEKIEQFVVALDSSIEKLKKWSNMVQQNLNVKERYVRALLIKAYSSLSFLLSENRGAMPVPKLKIIPFYQSSLVIAGDGSATRLMNQLESYMYYMNFSHSEAFFQWNLMLDRAEELEKVKVFQLFLRTLINAPTLTLSAAPIGQLLEYECLSRSFVPVITSSFFVTMGFVNATNDDSVTQVLTHWFRSMDTTAMHPGYQRLFAIWSKKNKLAYPDQRVERIVLKMLVDPKGSFRMTSKNLLSVVFGPEMVDEQTGMTPLLVTKAYAAIKTLEKLQVNYEDLHSHLPKNVIEQWLIPTCTEAQNMFEDYKYSNIQILEQFVEKVSFILHALTIMIAMLNLVDKLTGVLEQALETKKIDKKMLGVLLIEQDMVMRHVNKFRRADYFSTWAGKRLAQFRSALFYYHNMPDEQKKPKFFESFFVVQDMFPTHVYTQQSTEIGPILTTYFIIQRKMEKLWLFFNYQQQQREMSSSSSSSSYLID